MNSNDALESRSQHRNRPNHRKQGIRTGSNAQNDNPGTALSTNEPQRPRRTQPREMRELVRGWNGEVWRSMVH